MVGIVSENYKTNETSKGKNKKVNERKNK